MKKKKTAEEVKSEFRKKGKTVSAWARNHGYTPMQVLQVLNGHLKGNWGVAHEIAVALGIK